MQLALLALEVVAQNWWPTLHAVRRLNCGLSVVDTFSVVDPDTSSEEEHSAFDPDTGDEVVPIIFAGWAWDSDDGGFVPVEDEWTSRFSDCG